MPAFDATSWPYHLPVTVDNSANGTSALSYYQASVTLSGSAYTSFAAHALASGADIRVTDSDGTTLLSHALEGIDATNSKVYLLVKVPAVAAASSRTLYVYYGNAAASSVSSYATTIGPSVAAVGPTDIYTQSDMAGQNFIAQTILLRHQDGVNGGGSALNGQIYCLLHAGAGGNDTSDAKIDLIKSTDGGVTWGGKTRLATPAASHAFSLRSFGELSDGTLTIIYEYNTNTAAATAKNPTYVAKSTDGGTAWSNLGTSPANQMTVPWTVGTDIGVVYGGINQKANGDILVPAYAYTVAGANNPAEWWLKCPSGLDPTNGSNWTTQGIIGGNDSGATKLSECSVCRTGTDDLNWIAVSRTETPADGDLRWMRTTDGGSTWSAPVRFGLPNTAASPNNATAPCVIRTANGNLLATFGVRYGVSNGPGHCLSTDGGTTWMDRPVAMSATNGSFNVASSVDNGYPYTVQNSDGTIVTTYYRILSTGPNATNLARTIVTEDWVANQANNYDACESLSGWTSGGSPGATVSATRSHSGSNSIKIDNSAATGSTADYAYRPMWPSHAAQAPLRVAFATWLYASQNASTYAWRVRQSSDSFNTASSRLLAVSLASNANHVSWFNGTAYQDAGTAAPLNEWVRHGVNAAVSTTAVSGSLTMNNAVLATTLGQWATGTHARNLQFQGSSLSSNFNTTFWIDDVYTHQYTPNLPSVTVGAEVAVSRRRRRLILMGD